MRDGKFIALSLGWGIQSFTLAAMSALGELEPLDAAIHSDTTHERGATYAFSDNWTPWLEAHGVHVITANDKSSAERVWRGEMLPAYTAYTRYRQDGQSLRTCTDRWKIKPLRRWLRANGVKQAELLIGISWDESQRMKLSDVQWITNCWPLIERRMTRQDCINWLVRHDLEVPPKSSCVFCPYHSKEAWRELRMSGNGDWEKAVQVDEAIRKTRPPYDLFVHFSRKPLREVGENLDAQPSLFNMTENECTGFCFV